jgi:hypothetical protein
MTSEMNLEDDHAEVSYLPVLIPYAQGMPKRRWEIVPGVTLMPTSKSLKKFFDNQTGAIAKYSLGSGNYTIRVDKQPYLSHAKKRLHQFADGRSSDFYAQKIAKNLILAVSLECPNAGFVVGGHFGGREENGAFIPTNYANISSHSRAGHVSLNNYGSSD